jgi:hypothetical protein
MRIPWCRTQTSDLDTTIQEMTRKVTAVPAQTDAATDGFWQAAGMGGDENQGDYRAAVRQISLENRDACLKIPWMCRQLSRCGTSSI